MADTKENPNTKAPELSKEEMEQRRAEITAYYEEHIPALKVQLEYEGLLRDIEKCRAERVQAQMFVANTMAGPPDVPPVPAQNQNLKVAKNEFDAAKQGKDLANSIKKAAKEEATAKKRTLKKTT